MVYIYGIASTILGFFLINIISKARDKNVANQVSEGELVKLQLNRINEEDLRSKYSSGWLNLLAFLPLPLILCGIIVILYNLWIIEVLWVKVAMVYGLIGIFYAFNHVKNVDVGASGVGVTFLVVSVLWPAVIVLYSSKYLQDKRRGR